MRVLSSPPVISSYTSMAALGGVSALLTPAKEALLCTTSVLRPDELSFVMAASFLLKFKFFTFLFVPNLPASVFAGSVNVCFCDILRTVTNRSQVGEFSASFSVPKDVFTGHKANLLLSLPRSSSCEFEIFNFESCQKKPPTQFYQLLKRTKNPS